MKIETMDVVLLCGGKGQRLKSVIGDDCPKPIANINGQPFLDILISYSMSFGFKRFILCLGYKAEAVKEYYKNKKLSSRIFFSQENEPLGTAGAIKNAQPYIKSKHFLVMNGDSFCKIDFKDFIDYHSNKKAQCSLVLVKKHRPDEYGIVSLAPSGEIIRFDEKTRGEEGSFISAGIYLFDKSLFSLIAQNLNVSLEYDIFPRLIKHRFFGYISEAEFIDIGTPERYKEAIRFFKFLAL